MNLDYLKSFFVIVESNSISKAARKLHLTQPGLSMQLQNLENDLGAQLLIRSNKGVQLTKEGRVVFDQTKAILAIEKNMLKSIREIQADKCILNIHSCKSFGQLILPELLMEFKMEIPNLKVNLQTNSTCDIVKSFMSHEINIAIITDEHNYDDITSFPLMQDHLVLVTNKETGKDQLSLDELRDIPLIIRDDSSCTRLLLDDFIEPYGLHLTDLNILLSTNSLDTIKSTIMTSGGYSFLPKLFINDQLESGEVKEVKTPIDTTFYYYLALRNNSHLNKYENKFKEFLINKDFEKYILRYNL